MTKNVFRLEITMKEAISVKVGKPSGSFEENGSDLIFCEGSIVLFSSSIDLIKVALEVVEDHIELLFGKNDFSKLDNVGMFELLETLDLTQGVDFLPTFVFALHLFDGHDFSLCIFGHEDNSKGTDSYVFNYLIFLHLTNNYNQSHPRK